MENTPVETIAAESDTSRETAPATDDKYNTGIELSNACRQFYHHRQRATEEMKAKLTTEKTARNNSIDEAMDTLRREMASLMDIDLTLMKQLLTMNETIEELKQQRDHMTSLSTSSLDSDGSYWSVSETDMYGSDDEEELLVKHRIHDYLTDETSENQHHNVNDNSDNNSNVNLNRLNDKSDQVNDNSNISNNNSNNNITDTLEILDIRSFDVKLNTTESILSSYTMFATNKCFLDQNSIPFDSGVCRPS